MKKNLLNDERYYFEAFIKTVQYLETLTTHKNIMKNLETLVKIFYNSDFFAFYECGADGKIIEHRNEFSNNLFSKKVLEKIGEITVQVQESGFFASELVNPPDPYAMVFLPISKANQIISVIVIGHTYSERLPKYLLNIYLALGGIIGTTIEKLTMIQELRKQHSKLKENDRFLTNIFSSVKDGDITDRKKAEEEVTNVLEEIKRSNSELEQFAYIASHDLQEPLRMISGFANLLEKRYKDSLDKDAKDFIDFIIDGTTRMHDLINDLLTFSRIGTQGKVFKPTDMNVVLEATLNNVRISAIETNAIITCDPLPVVIADESQMAQILQNLISNAIKFHGAVHPKIHISGETKKNEWIFTITDNGIGIDSKDFERIFVIFQRLHKKGEYSGTGIGLTVCKKIIQRHGGKIWVESELKKGSIFHFSIPRNQNGVSTSKEVFYSD